jgi:uncharacterized protein YeaO (DUF488 family)
MAGSVRAKRIYAEALKSDGSRILVDHIWPRGVKKADARLDLWIKDVAPSGPLREWFDHRPERWAEFQRLYSAELAANPKATELRHLAETNDLTLLYAARDEAHNNAVALVQFLQGGSQNSHCAGAALGARARVGRDAHRDGGPDTGSRGAQTRRLVDARVSPYRQHDPIKGDR